MAKKKKKDRPATDRFWVLFKQSDVADWIMLDGQEDGFDSKRDAEACAEQWLEEQDPEGELLIIYGERVRFDIEKEVKVSGVRIRP